jgi:hypothetical protein
VYFGSLVSSVGIAKIYALDGRGTGIRFLEGARDISLLNSVQTGSGAHQAPYPISNVYRGLTPQFVKPATHLHLMPRLRMVELYLHSLIRLYGVVLN